jgi:hypothetical protein
MLESVASGGGPAGGCADALGSPPPAGPLDSATLGCGVAGGFAGGVGSGAEEPPYVLQAPRPAATAAAHGAARTARRDGRCPGMASPFLELHADLGEEPQ